MTVRVARPAKHGQRCLCDGEKHGQDVCATVKTTGRMHAPRTKHRQDVYAKCETHARCLCHAGSKCRAFISVAVQIELFALPIPTCKPLILGRARYNLPRLPGTTSCRSRRLETPFFVRSFRPPGGEKDRPNLWSWPALTCHHALGGLEMRTGNVPQHYPQVDFENRFC